MADEEPKSDAIQPEEKTQLFGEGGVQPPYLVIIDGPHKGARFPLCKGENRIGRLDECHVTLEDQSISRKHAELNLLEKGWTLKDLGSKNGTYVNGTWVEEEVVIGHKDILRFGIYTLRFVSEAVTAEEELELPPGQDVSEWGTVVAESEGRSPEGDTAEFDIPGNKGGKEITSPHSPLEEEGGEEEKEDETPPPPPKKSWLPRARLWVLLGAVFIVTLMGGLYFYWEYVLAPQEEAAAEQERIRKESIAKRKKRKKKPVAIPLGPPVPEKPATVPVFLDCVANPFPALIRFQGKEVGKTPLKVNVDLEPGESYSVEAQFEMSELDETYSEKLNFQVDADQSMVPLLFRAPVGTIKVISLPRDVSMYLEAYFDYSQYKGKPIKLTDLILNKPIYAPYGRYILELRQAKEVGDKSQVIEDIVYRREFKLHEENPAHILEVTDASLLEFPAEIRSLPSAADVYIDQKRVGETPFIGPLPVGKHTITLRKEGYFETSQEMETDINIPYKTEIILRTSLAGEKINIARDRMRQQLYKEAIESLSEVFNLKPTDHETAETRLLLGKIYLKLGEFQKAQGYFEQTKGEAAFKYLAKLGLAEVLAEQGQIAGALLPLVEVLLNTQSESEMREANQLLQKISPLRSVVYIQSEPPGAEVYLNEDKLEQTTPILLHEIGLGSYRLRLIKPGYQPLNLTLNLTVNEFNPVLAKLKPLPE